MLSGFTAVLIVNSLCINQRAAKLFEYGPSKPVKVAGLAEIHHGWWLPVADPVCLTTCFQWLEACEFWHADCIGSGR